jgi:fatty-acyl-CoA synthase
MPEDKTLPQPPNWISLHKAAKPNALVVIGPDRSMTWSELYERSRALAKRLYAMGLRPGDQACLMSYNLPWYHEISQACWWLDVGMVMVGYRLKAPEIEYIVQNSDSRVFFFLDEFAERLHPERDSYQNVVPGGFVSSRACGLPGSTPYEELFLNTPDVDLENLEAPEKVGDTMIYTSGTTGRPKGAARKADFVKKAGVMEYLFAGISLLKFQSDEVHLICCPLYHSAPAFFGLVPFMMGGTLVLQPRWDPVEFLRLVDAHKVTSTHIVPTMVSQLLQVPEETARPYDFTSMRTVICGAAPLFPQYKIAFLDRFGDVLYEYYGSTETGVNTFISPQEMRQRPTSVGRAFADNELKIYDSAGREVPDGERGVLYMTNSIMMDGYYKNERATQECFIDKYMTVGDVAVRDHEGYIYIVDRVKDMIIRGGVNIYPAEVEAVLCEMPGIRDVAVVGKPDSEWGEVVVAFVVGENDSPPAIEEIKAYCLERMASHKVPVLVQYIREIPRTPTGKVLKRELRELVKDMEVPPR